MVKSSRRCLITICIYLAGLLFAMLLPLLLNLPGLSSLVGATYGEDSKLQEFFGASGFLAVLFLAGWTIRQKHPHDFLGYMEILLPAMVALFWLNILTENTQKSWDYLCYERAAQAFLNGKNPYLDCYLYPPFVLSIFDWIFRGMQFFIKELRGFPLRYDKAWMYMFYFYQCVQWFLVVAAYLLSCRLAEKFGLSKRLSLGVVTVLFILNNPLLRTVHWNQVNLWVLNFAILLLLFDHAQPYIAGFLAAIGTHIKIYPALFVAPWILLKDRKAIIGFSAGIILLLGLTIATIGTGSTWLQFIINLITRPQGDALRDNSLHSILFNVARIARIIKPWDLKNQSVNAVSNGISILIGIGFMVRLAVRNRILRKTQESDPSYAFQRDGMMVDMFGLMLLASPMVWEHHYIFAIPLILWALAKEIKEEHPPVASFIAFLFIFGLPTFDIFPLSYLRLAGLLILLVRSGPPLARSTSSTAAG